MINITFYLNIALLKYSNNYSNNYIVTTDQVSFICNLLVNKT